jgi:3-hydroxybutyryl-CoA dehydrogenase
MEGNEIVVGVAGAGTMGTGIAQIAAAAGHQVILFDIQAQALKSSVQQIESNLVHQLQRNRITSEVLNATLARILTDQDLKRFSQCLFVIEAVAEELTTKQDLLRKIEEIVDPLCTLGTNTSSLSVTAISSVLQNRDRCLGMHFFNPAVVMPLVELVRTTATSERIFAQARTTIEQWGKLTVSVMDTPGFIVNRIARPFYLEALKILEEGSADIATIDWAMRECAGFKMGPFELMDLIGTDVNYTVSESIFTAFHFEPRFRPSHLQRQLVEAGKLGRKTGKGYYDYSEHAPRPQPVEDRTLGEKIANRITLMIFNEAAHALSHHIASIEEIDLAMMKAASYPRGPLRWADEIGIKQVVTGLQALQDEFRDDRYRPNPLLERMMKTGEHFYPR